MIYFGCIIIYVILLTVFDCIIVNKNVSMGNWYFILWVWATFVAVLIVDALVALIIRRLVPQRIVSGVRPKLACSKKEGVFLEKIGIKKWKEIVPEFGKFTNFRKNKILEPKSNEYLSRYILEANYGIIIHFASVFFGFLIILITPRFWYCIGFPIAIVNAICNLMPMAILRYNLRKLHVLYKVNLKKNLKNGIDEN